ncbi:hypothetical protein [Streptomyces sp. Ag109_O5-10]|uniref:hypothetical protein n=1 Tax=Streptomyces sp. Ag109_O5-10 TaxID=1855349 RepID=UPI00089CE771|nr:hypothetical protein [Streptomyces sp. Ag109_O5-10]SEF08696.1 hypothetical protein SAMN05216533_6094 [Streptomyces sp. Ag109_O5-10]
MPDRNPAALRIAVARLIPDALPKFDTHRAEAVNQARDEFGLLPGRHFAVHASRPTPKGPS